MDWLASTALLITLLSMGPADAADLDAPDKAVIGTKIDVTWTGPGNHYDTIWISPPEAPDDVKGFGRALINHGRNPVQIIVPDMPGTYELRFWLRNEERIIARRPLEVVDVPTSLDAVESANAGATIEVMWQGPGNRYDCIVIVPADSPESAEPLAEVNVYGRSPQELRLPETAGDYELRYQTATLRRTLVRRPLTIRPVTAQLEAPEVAQPGEIIQIYWQGPANHGDWIGVYPSGDEAGWPPAWLSLNGLRSPVTLRLPEEVGDYELRYTTSQDRNVLASRPIRVQGTSLPPSP